MGLSNNAIASSSDLLSESAFEWYADLVRIGPKKLVLFTHATTLFGVVALDVSRTEIRSLDALLRDRLPALLLRLDISPQILDRWGTESLYTTTASRQVLGSMNEQIRSLKFYITQAGGIERCDEVEISLWLSGMILSAVNYDKLSERFKAFLTRLAQ
ncbi:MAG: hypothetical protein Kow00121_30520 [Elainellaceae cyanobacterium]